jgi:PAS domain S-box-containing protein
VKINIYKKFREAYQRFYTESSASIVGAKNLNQLKANFNDEEILKSYEAIGPFVYFISDYSSHKFIKVGGASEILFGYKNSEIEGKGFAFTFKITPIKDLVRLLFGANLFWKYFKETKIEDRSFLRVNYTLTYKRKDGSTFEAFQQNRPILFDEKGNAIYFLGIITDISEFKTKFSAHEHYILNVKDPQNIIKHQIKIKENEFNTTVSQAELKVLNLIAEGLRTKEIAEKLFLSEHTINIHRKNLLVKLESNSSSQLIKKALMAGII